MRDIGVLGDDDLLAELAHVAHVEMAPVGAFNMVANRVGFATGLAAHATGVVRPYVGLNILLQLRHGV